MGEGQTSKPEVGDEGVGGEVPGRAVGVAAWVAWLVGSQGLALGVVLVKQSGYHWSP